jgi:hypothetical protein
LIEYCKIWDTESFVETSESPKISLCNSKCLLLKKGIERKEAVKIANIITDGFLNKANIPDEHLQGFPSLD